MSATEELYRSYLDLRWNFDPCAATAAGVTTEDHRLAQFDTASMRTHLAAFRSIASAAEQLEVEDPQEEIDRTAFLDEVRVTVFRFEHERPHVHNPAFWLSHLFEAVYGLLRHHEGAPAHRARSVLDRLTAAPGFLGAALDTLKDPPQVFLDTAAAMIGGGERLFQEATALVGGALPEAEEALDAAAREAATALKKFGIALTTSLHAHPDELSFAVGEEEFNRRLHYEHALQAGAPELYRYGLHLMDEVEAEVAELARRIDARESWRDVVQRLRASAPAMDPLSEYGANMERSRRFVVDKGLVTIPDGPLEVVPTPVFLRPLIPFAAYHPPGPFASERTGLFYVTSPDSATASPDGRLCLHELAATSLHEGYPGHHLQMLTAQGLETQVRRNLWTPVTVEGWALYCEEMMAEQGFFDTPEEMLFQRVHLLWRAVRIVLDVGLHTRGMTPEEATDLLASRLAMDRSRAAAEVSRYCAWPTYQLCYAVGRREILQLRDVYRERAGSEFALRRFHDDFLSYGGLPVSLIRWGMGLGIEE